MGTETDRWEERNLMKKFINTLFGKEPVKSGVVPTVDTLIRKSHPRTVWPKFAKNYRIIEYPAYKGTFNHYKLQAQINDDWVDVLTYDGEGYSGSPGWIPVRDCEKAALIGLVRELRNLPEEFKIITLPPMEECP